MAERVVSVKMPKSLVRELNRLREQDHYLDLSEQIRSVVRRKSLELTNPYVEGMRTLRNDIQSDATRHTAKEQIIHNLIRMLQEDGQ